VDIADPVQGTNATLTNIFGLRFNRGQFTNQLVSTVATGTAPFVVASTTNIPNLNASSLNGATFAAPGAIGSGTASTGAFTTLSASSGATALAITANSTSANGTYLQINNSGTANTFLGAWKSLLGSGNATDTVLLSSGATLGLGVNSGTNVPVSISSTGLAVTGTGTFSGPLTLQSVSGTETAANWNQVGVAQWTWRNTATTGDFYLSQGGADHIRVSKTTGNTILGGTLSVAGALSATGNVVAFSDSANGNSAFESTFSGTTRNGVDLADSTDTSGVFFGVFRKASGTAIGSITRVTTTDAVAYNTTSDGRLKENLRDFTDSGRLIDSLKPRVFDWKNSDENGKNVVGFIAQEEHAADPIFAHIGAVSVGDEDPETITKQWQRSDSALIPILVAELKSLRARVAALESK
jgi:hypothetical protein